MSPISLGIWAVAGASSKLPWGVGLLSTAAQYTNGNDINVNSTTEKITVFGSYSGGGSEYAQYTSLTTAGVLSFNKIYTNTGTTYWGGGTDSSGNIYGGGGVEDAGVKYLLIAKHDSSGALTWQRRYRITPTDYQDVTNVVTDSSGNTYVAAVNWSGGYATLGSHVIKYDSSGNVAWENRMQLTSQIISTICMHLSAAGITQAWTYSSYTVLGRYSSAGTFAWKKLLTTAGSGFSVKSAATDLNGVTYFVAEDYNSNKLLAKFNSSGVAVWVKTISDVVGNVSSVEVDSTGSYIYVLTSYGQILKFDSSGTLVWARRLVGINGGSAMSIKVNGSYIYFRASKTIGSNSVIVLSRFNIDGTGLGTYTISNQTFTYETGSHTIGTGSVTAEDTSISLSGFTGTKSTPTYTVGDVTATWTN